MQMQMIFFVVRFWDQTLLGLLISNIDFEPCQAAVGVRMGNAAIYLKLLARLQATGEWAFLKKIKPLLL